MYFLSELQPIEIKQLQLLSQLDDVSSSHCDKCLIIASWCSTMKSGMNTGNMRCISFVVLNYLEWLEAIVFVSVCGYMCSSTCTHRYNVSTLLPCLTELMLIIQYMKANHLKL